MAQTGFTPISLYYTTTASAAPTAGNLVAGELALNNNDGKLFYKDSSGVVQTIASKAGNSGSFTNLAYTGTLTGGTGVVAIGTNQIYKDASGNLGIGSTTARNLEVIRSDANTSYGSAAAQFPINIRNTDTTANNWSVIGFNQGTSSYANPAFVGAQYTSSSAAALVFGTSSTERMRIDSSGNVIVSGTSTSSDEATYQSSGVFVSRRASSAGTTHANFLNGGNVVGSITSNTVNTFYNVTSDYRLKENATPVTTGLQTITALNPVNFDWISKNFSDTGFLAHEFQAVIPNSVMGTKDAIDENGSPIYQQIDRSGAIPFLVAAIKELNAKVDAQATTIATLQARLG